MLSFLTGCLLPLFGETPLTTLNYQINGARLEVTPEVLSVPKGIIGSIGLSVAPQLAEGAFVEATLRGPSFPARRLLGPPNEPLLLPPLQLVGEYQLDDIKLVDAVSGEVRLRGTPSSVPVNVFDEVLVSRVTSRPLSLEEIEGRGIVIDQENFRAVEFEVGFVVDGQTIPVRFPVVTPDFRQSTEIIPAAELEERLATAAAANQQLQQTAVLPPELEGANLNIQVQPMNVQFVEPSEVDLALKIPPIPALLVIPGNIGFLNQFFSVQLYTENAAPDGSGLSVREITAELILPEGPDQVPGTFASPGDDPLRFARVGEAAEIFSTIPVVQPGTDGEIGTADDVGRLQPGDTGQAEFLVEGLQEGLHILDLELHGLLDGLPAGSVEIMGAAKGSVLVRNPNFSLAFLHPRTIRAGEPYEASVTILNTGGSVANLLGITLPAAGISGATLISDPTVQFESLAPGETVTATFQLLAQRTGAITFSQLTSDDDITGRFRLRTGIDERGVALSPDTLALPDYVDELPADVLAAAMRVLGQALGISSAGRLPAGVISVSQSTLRARAVELAEAGQRFRYGDAPERIFADLLLDWEGGRRASAGFSQIIAETNAGQQFRAAIFAAMEAESPGTAPDNLAGRAPDLAGRGESWQIAASDQANLLAMPGTVYSGAGGNWSVSPDPASLVWVSSGAVANASVSVLQVATNGTAERLDWTLANFPDGACAMWSPGSLDLVIDENCDGFPEDTLTASVTAVSELPPEGLAVIQDTDVLLALPEASCFFAPYKNYGNVLAVLFSKPMRQSDVDIPEAYQLDNGYAAGAVRIQNGGRVALLTMEIPVGTFVPASLSLDGIRDVNGNVLPPVTLPITTTASEGISIAGRVLRANGESASDVPVTLTYFNEEDSSFGCDDFTRRISQIRTTEDGSFQFDYITAGVPYSISATDTAGLSPEAIEVILNAGAETDDVRRQMLELAEANPGSLLESFIANSLPEAIAIAEGVDRAVFSEQIDRDSVRLGNQTVMVLRFRGRASVSGTVLDANGERVPDAAVNLFPDPDSREQGRGLFSDANGRFQFFGVPLGAFTVEVVDPERRRRTVDGRVNEPGESQDIEIVLVDTAVATSSLQGTVFEPDGVSPHPGGQVVVGRLKSGGAEIVGVVAIANVDGNGRYNITDIPIGEWDIVALSSDGRRRGSRVGIDVESEIPANANVVLQGTATVIGRVEFPDGSPATNVLVAGGAAIVRTDSAGLFTLEGVPTGPSRTIEVGVEAKDNDRVEFTRLGSENVDVLGGQENFAVIRFNPVGSIVGTVRDGAGEPIPNIRVALPLSEDTFGWTDADENGVYEFANIPLRNEWEVSAGAPPTADTDTSGLVEEIRQGGDIIGALSEAYGVFVGINDPLLNGEGANFNPLTWGFAKTALTFDGQVALANITHLREGTVSGVTINGQGVPIGARVRLTGVGPSATGASSFVIRGEANSDPATGEFSFPGQLLAGNWGLQAATPFSPVVIRTNGSTSADSPDATGIVLQFPHPEDTNGRLRGLVLLPDGTPAGADVNVAISFGDFEIRTVSNGLFDTQIDLPAATYLVTATDPLTGLTGQSSISVEAVQTNYVEVTLLDKGGLTVTVVDGLGAPVANASVDLSGGRFPREDFSGVTDDNGVLNLQNLFEGPYSVCAHFSTGLLRLGGRSGAYVQPRTNNTVTVVLEATGTLEGQFVRSDGTPFDFAQIALADIGFTATDAEGRFTFSDVPLGNWRIVGTDAVTGRYGLNFVSLDTAGSTVTVQVVEADLGDLEGFVYDGRTGSPVPGASLQLNIQDGFSAQRQVTAGPDGAYRFVGVPAADFRLFAQNPVNGNRATIARTFPQDTALLIANINLATIADLFVNVLDAEGNPATNATVNITRIVRSEGDTDTQGTAVFELRNAGIANIVARAFTVDRTRSIANLEVAIPSLEQDTIVELQLRGVGDVTGTVFSANGDPVVGATVVATFADPLFPRDSETVLTDADGRYEIGNVPVGDFNLQALEQAVSGIANGTIASNGEVVPIDIQPATSAVLPDAFSARTVRLPPGCKWK